MGNTSATGGVLTPTPPPPPDDAALDAVFQALVSSVIGMDGALVRPRWQPVVPKQPEPGTDWCAIGVTSSEVDAGPWIAMDPTNTFGLYFRHEDLGVLATFYGPNSKSNAAALRDGLSIVQNLEPLLQYQMRFIEGDSIRAVPELVNEQWVKRQDLPLRFRRKVTRTYAIETILIADINIRDDTVINDTVVVPPGATVLP